MMSPESKIDDGQKLEVRSWKRKLRRGRVGVVRGYEENLYTGGWSRASTCWCKEKSSTVNGRFCTKKTRVDRPAPKAPPRQGWRWNCRRKAPLQKSSAETYVPRR